jgi:hypothetical protein
MNTGKIEQINWQSFYVYDFYPEVNVSFYNHYKNREQWTTCGTPILAILTGLSFKYIEKQKPNKHWTDRSITQFLKNRGFDIVELTKNNVTNVYWEQFPINERHVILLNIEMDALEASWFLLHDNILYHNLYKMSFNSYFFLNKPIQSAFILNHGKWKKFEKFAKIIY